VTKIEEGKRWVDVNNSKTPGNARLKDVKIPQGFITLEGAREHYNLSRTIVYQWIRKGFLVTKEFGIRYTGSSLPTNMNSVLYNALQLYLIATPPCLRRLV